MKRAIVTGGTRGIGFATAKLLAERGYEVTATYFHSEEDADKARKLLPSVKFIRADVSSETDMRALFGERLDLIVANAAIPQFSQVQDVSWEEYVRVMNVNMGGVFLAAKFAVPRMLGNGGAIVNIASVWGETGGSCESVYSASKGAVIAFTKALAKELAPSRITVNCISPGAVETEMNARLSAEERRAFEAEIPLGRFASPEEIAEAVFFLATHPYITGQVLGVNGGYLI